jgi:hypothetical protein
MVWTLQRTHVQAGQYQAVLTGAGDPPVLEARHAGGLLEGLEIREISGASGEWQVNLSLPPVLMADEVQVVMICDATTGTVLDCVTITTGLDPSEDLLAEMAVMRAELDMLKKAFRRHMATLLS